jgi:AcrR family transcriptional regulator
MIRKLAPDKRQSFLDAALKLFVANGVQNTSTAAIAKEAGTATGTLFLYFPTKQALLDELALQIGRQQSEYIRGLLAPQLAARQYFWKIWDGSIRWFLDHMQAYQYVQQVRDAGIISPAAVAESQESLTYYFEAIRKGLQEGSLKPYPAEVIGTVLYQDIVAAVNLIKTQPRSRHKKIIQSIFQIFWDGIARQDQ